MKAVPLLLTPALLLLLGGSVLAGGLTAVTRPTVKAPPSMNAAATPPVVVNPNQQAAYDTLLQPLHPANAPRTAVAVRALSEDEKGAQAEAADARLLAWQRVRAEEDSAYAQHALGMRYRTGRGVPADPQLARLWLERAAANGSEAAKLALKELNNPPATASKPATPALAGSK